MKKRKAGAALFAAGLLFASMTVCAAPQDMQPTSTVKDADGNTHDYYAVQQEVMNNDSLWAKGDVIQCDNKFYIRGDNGWTDFAQEASKPSEGSPSEPGSSSAAGQAPSVAAPGETAAPAASAPAMTVEEIISQAQSIALQAEALSEGFANMAEMQTAAALNKSAGEYYNNAVVETPGIEEATPVAQGGNLIVDGVVTNITAVINKVDIAFVDSVRAVTEGTVLNVVDVRFPVKEATINFYMPGVTADAQITALQYADGVWTDVEVKEVRADHVILTLTRNGRVAFIAK